MEVYKLFFFSFYWLNILQHIPETSMKIATTGEEYSDTIFSSIRSWIWLHDCPGGGVSWLLSGQLSSQVLSSITPPVIIVSQLPSHVHVKLLVQVKWRQLTVKIWSQFIRLSVRLDYWHMLPILFFLLTIDFKTLQPFIFFIKTILPSLSLTAISITDYV